MPYSGTKFKPQNQINQNLSLNNALLANSAFDTFTKTNNNINFTGLFTKKPLPKLGNDMTPEEISLLHDTLEQKEDVVFKWLARQPKYSDYFRKEIII